MAPARQKVLILDGMWNKALAAVRSLGKRGLYVTAGEKTFFATSLFSRHCRRRFVYPDPSLHPERFLSVLEDELKKGAYEAVFPMELSTQLLLTVPRTRERLERYARIPFADASLTAKLNDKAFVMRFAEDNDVEIPRTFYPSSEAELQLRADEITCPAVIKPRSSSGSRGLVYVKEKSQLAAAYRKVHCQYPFPIVQEYIPDGGGTFGVGALLNARSETRASFAYKRLRSYPVSGGPSTLRESIKRDDIRDIAEALLHALNWSGIAHVEFKVDPRDKRPKLLEINPRFWGSLQLAVEAGMDFPFLLYKMAVDGDIEPAGEYQEGVRCRWLLPGDFMHFISNSERFRLEPSFFDFRARDDILSVSDPLPTMGRILSAAPLLFDKELRKLIRR